MYRPEDFKTELQLDKPAQRIGHAASGSVGNLTKTARLSVGRPFFDQIPLWAT